MLVQGGLCREVMNAQLTDLFLSLAGVKTKCAHLEIATTEESALETATSFHVCVSRDLKASYTHLNIKETTFQANNAKSQQSSCQNVLAKRNGVCWAGCYLARHLIATTEVCASAQVFIIFAYAFWDLPDPHVKTLFLMQVGFLIKSSHLKSKRLVSPESGGLLNVIRICSPEDCSNK